jgi:hypothetical protein
MATLDRPRIEYRTPVDLVAEVKRGFLRIPPFQRGFKWESTDVIALFDSLLRGFPIGNLLFWRRPAPETTLQIGPLRVAAPRLDSAFWVVDGQQRVTSLVGALAMAEEATDPRFRIYLDLDTSMFSALGLRQRPSLNLLPVSRLIDTTSLLAWMRENADWLTDAQIGRADAAAKAIREYQIPTYVVSSDDEEALRKIFDRLNSTGKPLSRAEVFHALHSGFAGDEPADLQSLGGVPAQLGFGRIDDRLALRCVLAYRGGDIFRDDFHREFSSDDDRRETFQQVTGALRTVVEFLQEETGIPHGRVLPYTHVIPVLIRFVRRHNEPEGRTRHLLRRWVWRDAVAGTLTRGTSVAAIRQALTAADHADAVTAAQSLLRILPAQHGFVADLDRVHLNHAAAKINLLGVLAARPVDLASGEPLDIGTAFDGGNPVRDIIDDRAIADAKSFANRVVTGANVSRPVRIALVECSPDIAATHLVDRRGQELLRAGDAAAFLRHRRETVSSAIGSHVDSMAEWGARDGRSVADMMRSAA